MSLSFVVLQTNNLRFQQEREGGHLRMICGHF